MIPDHGNVQIVQRHLSAAVGQIEAHYVRISMSAQPVEYPHPIALDRAYVPNHVLLQESVLRHRESTN